jgi:hypothetical protein
MAFGSDPVKRPEPDQAIATADIENNVARPECGSVEDTIATSL